MAGWLLHIDVHVLGNFSGKRGRLECRLAGFIGLPMVQDVIQIGRFAVAPVGHGAPMVQETSTEQREVPKRRKKFGILLVMQDTTSITPKQEKRDLRSGCLVPKGVDRRRLRGAMWIIGGASKDNGT